MMDTAKIFLGIALVMFSAALMVTPSNAYGFDTPREVGNGNTAIAVGIGITTGFPYSSSSSELPATCHDRLVLLYGDNLWIRYTVP